MSLIAFSLRILAITLPAVASIFPVQSIATGIDPGLLSNSENSEGRVFSSGVLPNGLRYVIERVPNAPVGLAMVVGAGQLDETPAQLNAAHVIEHILVSDTESGQPTFVTLKSAGQIVSLGANTYNKSTRFRVKAITPNGRRAENLLQVVREWLSLDIRSESVNREIASVGEEGAGTMESDVPYTVETRERVFGGHSYRHLKASWFGRSKLTTEAVRSFYRKWYRPNRVTLIINGDVDVGQFESAIMRTLSYLPGRMDRAAGSTANKDPEEIYDVVLNRKSRILAIERPNATQSMLRVFAKSKNPPTFTVDQDVRSEIFSSIVEAIIIRMNRTRGVGDGRSLNYGSVATDVRGVSIFSTVPISMSNDRRVDLANVESSVRRTVELFAQIKAYGATEAEFAFAKQKVRNDIASKAEGLEERLNRYLDRTQYDIAGPMPDRPARMRMADEITLADVNNFLRAAINLRQDLDVVLIGPAPNRLTAVLVAAIQRGMRSGALSAPGAPAKHAFVKRIFPAPPSVNPREPRSVKPDAVAITLPNGEPAIIRRMAQSEAPRYDVLSMGALVDNSDILTGQGRKIFQIKGAFIARPASLAEEIFVDYLEKMGVSSSLEISANQTIVTIAGPAGSLDSIMQVAEAVVGASTGEKKISVGPYSSLIPAIGSAIERRDGIAVDKAYVNYAVETALRRFAPTTLILSGDFDLSRAAALTASYVSEIKLGSQAIAAQSQMGSAELISPRHLESNDALHVSRSSPKFRTYSQEVIKGSTSSAALSVLVQLLNMEVFRVLRAAGGYDASVWSNVTGPDSPIGKSIVDVTFSYAIENSRVEAFERLVDGVIASAEEGHFSHEQFLSAKRLASENALAEEQDARSSSPATLKRLLSGHAIDDVVDANITMFDMVTEAQVTTAAKSLFSNQADDARY